MLTNKELLTLNGLPGIGRVALLHILKTGSNSPGANLSEILNATKQEYSRLRLPDEGALSAAASKAGHILELIEKNDLALLRSDEIPEKLREIPKPPAFLLTKGDNSILDKEGIAVIGTRTPTDWGKRVAERFGFVLAEKGFVVVSGLALGCDTAGHVGCLKAHGKTIAVMPCGLDEVYPPNNCELAQQIVDSGGCLVSEYLPLTKMHKSSFVERDRLQSGLSRAVIVVETGIKGGTQQTVKFAKEQGRQIACLDHPSLYHTHESVQGNRKMISDNLAVPLKSREDLETFLESLEG